MKMKALIDGVMVELSQEDIDAFNSIQIIEEVTLEKRISSIEQAITDIAIQTMGVGIDE